MKLAIVAAVVGLAVNGAAGARTPISLEDLLHGEDFGRAMFSPSGEQVVFTRRVAIAERPTEGFDDPSVVRERIFLTDRRGGPVEEISCREGAYCSLSPWRAWSPEGDRLMLLEAAEGRYNLAVWQAATGKTTTLPGWPERTFAAFDWAGDSVVYAVLPEGQRQWTAHFQMLTRLNAIWRGGWLADDGLATVSSANPLFEPSAPAAGALMLARPADGQVARLAEGDFVTVEASPDGKHVAVVRLAERRATALSWQGRRGELQLYRVTADGAKLVRRFDELDVQFESLVWNASGNALLVGGKAPEEAKEQARLHVIDARGGEIRAIALPEGAALNDPAAGWGLSLLSMKWVGSKPAAILAREGVSSAHAAEAGVRMDYGNTARMRFDLHVFTGGEWQNLTSFSKAPVNRFVAPDGAEFALVVADGALWRVAPGSAPERLSPESGPRIVGFAADGRLAELETAYYRTGREERLAVYALGASGAPERGVLDLKTGRFSDAQPSDDFLADSPDLQSVVLRVHEDWVTRLVLKDAEGEERQLAQANTELADRAVAPVERFSYTSGGKPLTGWVVKPPNARAGQPLPAILVVYGGTVWGDAPPTVAGATTQNPLPQAGGQLLAAQGYAVVYPSLPVEPGATSDVMAALAQHSVAAIDALAAKGVIDPERVGVMGQSFGGYSTAAILAKCSDRFRAGIALVGAYDWIQAYGLLSQAERLTPDGRDQIHSIKYVEGGQIGLKKPFWEDPEPYIRNSPIFHVEKIHAPLLMLHGDLDLSITGLDGAQRMYNALVRAGKQPVLVRYWGEGHVAHSEWAIRDQWSRITTWLAAHLGKAGS